MHGFDDLGPALTTLSRQGRWQDMGALIDDNVLDAFAVTGPVEQIGATIASRFAGLVDRISFYSPSLVDPSAWSTIADNLRRSISDRPKSPGHPA